MGIRSIDQNQKKQNMLYKGTKWKKKKKRILIHRIRQGMAVKERTAVFNN